jgi:hypothetical protein
MDIFLLCLPSPDPSEWNVDDADNADERGF